MRQALQKLEALTEKVNATPSTWKGLITVAIGVIFFRNWLEYLSNNSTPTYLVYNHFISWWILVFLAIATINHRINKRPAEENLVGGWSRRLDTEALPVVRDQLVDPGQRYLLGG